MKRSRTSISPIPDVVEDGDMTDDSLEDVLTLWSAEFMDESESVERRLTSDLGRLQGQWTTISGRRKAELLIAGQRLTVRFAEGDIYVGAFSLGISGPLTTLDVRIEKGPAQHRGLPVMCICELNGETLRWCNASPGDADRPTAFDEHNPRLLCLLFRRARRAQVR